MILDVSFRRSFTAVSFLFEQLGNLERTLSLERSWSRSEDREALATASTSSATSTTGQDFLRHVQVLNFARNSVYRFALTPLCSALPKTLYEIVLVLTRSLLLALRCRTIGRAAEAGSAPGIRHCRPAQPAAATDKVP